MEEEKRELKAPPHKQLIMDIGKTKYTVSGQFEICSRNSVKSTGLAALLA